MGLVTYDDLTSHAIDYGQQARDAETERFARRAVLAAYQDLPNHHRWSYYKQVGRIVTSDDYSTGTVEFDYTGGASERMLTLTSGTWPSWAALGSVVIDNVPYAVATRVSDSIITLTNSENPGADVAASTTYAIYRDTYVLPCDFAAIGDVVMLNQAYQLQQISVNDWVVAQKSYRGPGTPTSYCITSDPNYFGELALRLYPYPDDSYELSFLYQRRPRPLVRHRYSTGTVAVTSGSTTLTGTGTTWTSDMVGSVVRIAASGETDVPTGLSGAQPYLIERTITGYTSATVLTLDSDPAQTLSTVKYMISDPVDVEPGAMMTFLMREIEKHTRLIRRLKADPQELMEHRKAHLLALEADSRHFQPKAAGDQILYRPRLSDMPIDLSV
jgi:hypothetical protein